MSMEESSHNNSIETNVDPPSQPVAVATSTNTDNNAVAVAPAEEATTLRANELCQQLLAVVVRRDEFPARQRETIVDLAEEFLQNLGNDIHDMVTDQTYGPEYHGLDSDRDSVAEITTALEFYPETLARRKETDWNPGRNEWVDVTEDDEAGDYPIMCLALLIDPDSVEESCGKHVCNTQAVAFIDLFARLAIEYGSFDEAERGGLLITTHRDNEDDNNDDNGMSDCVLKQLVYHSYPSYGDEHNRRVDERFLKELMELRRLGLFLKEDIERFQLIHTVVSFRRLDEHRARFLLDWDPTQLVHVNDQDFTPLGCAAFESVAAFQWTLASGLRYYPRMVGISLLFQNNAVLGETPFQTACRRFGNEEVMRVLDTTLAAQHDHQRFPLNSLEAVIAAAITTRIHLDCVYFLVRRRPEMITVDTTNTNSIRTSNRRRDEDDDDTIKKNCGGTDTTPDNGDAGKEEGTEAGRHHDQAGEAFCSPDPQEDGGGGGGEDQDKELAINSTNKRKREISD